MYTLNYKLTKTQVSHLIIIKLIPTYVNKRDVSSKNVSQPAIVLSSFPTYNQNGCRNLIPDHWAQTIQRSCLGWIINKSTHTYTPKCGAPPHVCNNVSCEFHYGWKAQLTLSIIPETRKRRRCRISITNWFIKK